MYIATERAMLIGVQEGRSRTLLRKVRGRERINIAPAQLAKATGNKPPKINSLFCLESTCCYTRVGPKKKSESPVAGIVSKDELRGSLSDAFTFRPTTA